jgi:hypothetical protein
MATVRARLILPGLVASAVIAGAMIAAGSVASAGPVGKRCGVVIAGGHKYVVSSSYVSCSFARKWVSALAGKRLRNHAVGTTLTGAPQGYSCRGGTALQGSPAGVSGNVQVSGNCAKGIGLGTSPYFNWVIQR